MISRKTRMIFTALAIVIVFAVVAGFATIHYFSIRILGDFPRHGSNLSDLQPDDIMQYIADITGADDNDIFTVGFGTISVTRNFEWSSVAIGIEYETITGSNLYYSSQLRSEDSDIFFITASQRVEPSIRRYYLHHVLEALRFIPQEQIYNQVDGSPDGYGIIFWGRNMPANGNPQIFYNANGLTESNNNYIGFHIFPMFRSEDGSYGGTPNKTGIQLFYVINN